MWTGAISLSMGVERVKDEEGFISEVPKFSAPIMASVENTTRSDEILASQLGYTADVIVKIDKCAYVQSAYFRDEATGYEYDIKRTYVTDKSRFIQITGERREHGKDQL